MPNRLDDTLNFLDRARGDFLLSPQEVRDFRTRVESREETLDYTGNLLSLNLTRFGTRPDVDARHAIRLCILASACASRSSQREARQFAVRETTALKTKTRQEINKEVTTRVRAVLAQTEQTVQAAKFVLKTRGGPNYAKALSTLCDGPVEEEMLRLHKKQLGGVGVMLIDMQSKNVGYEYFGGRTVLQHQQNVLELAALHRMYVYDIVIDKEYAEGRRAKTIFTVPQLEHAFTGASVRHIAKPGHPSFEGTTLDETLERDRVEWLVVMGYDANQCVKATIFGGPEQRQPKWRTRTRQEQDEYMRLHPKPKSMEEVAFENVGFEHTPYMPGLLDRGINVLTSRAILASGTMPLDEEYEVLARR